MPVTDTQEIEAAITRMITWPAQKAPDWSQSASRDGSAAGFSPPRAGSSLTGGCRFSSSSMSAGTANPGWWSREGRVSHISNTLTSDPLERFSLVFCTLHSTCTEFRHPSLEYAQICHAPPTDLASGLNIYLPDPSQENTLPFPALIQSWGLLSPVFTGKHFGGEAGKAGNEQLTSGFLEEIFQSTNYAFLIITQMWTRENAMAEC